MIAVSETMAVCPTRSAATTGSFPQLVLFDCHARHHPMSDKRWAPCGAASPGRVRINDSSMLMVRAISRVVDPSLGASIGSTMNQLQLAAAGRGGDTAAVARTLQGQMTDLIGRLEKREFGDADMRAVLAALIDEGINGQYRDYAGAEQATMAIGSVANFMYQRGLLKSAGSINAGLAQLQAAVGNDERFRPDQFVAALRSFRGTVGL